MLSYSQLEDGVSYPVRRKNEKYISLESVARPYYGLTCGRLRHSRTYSHGEGRGFLGNDPLPKQTELTRLEVPGAQEYGRINSSQPVVPHCYLRLVGGRRFCNVPHMVSLVGECDTPDMR